MNRYRCTIHNVTFTCEPPENATEDIRKACTYCECPLCQRLAISQLDNHLRRAMNHRDALLRAIEVKQECLVERIA